MLTNPNARAFAAGMHPTIVLALLLVFLLGASSPAQCEDNILRNSDLSAGATTPDDWHPSRRVGCDSFKWVHPKGAPGELTIANAPGKDAAWTQKVTASPGWYHLSGDLRTNGGNEPGAAFLAIKQGNDFASTISREEDWQRKGFYIRIERDEPFEIQCGLSSPLLRTEIACRNIRLEKIRGAPPARSHQFQLKSKPTPAGTTINWISVGVLLVLGVSGGVYYWFSDDAESASSKTHQSDSQSITARWSPTAKRNAVIGSFALLLLAMMALTRVDFVPGTGFMVVTPLAARSDEPHYIIALNSLLFDHDFQLQDDYARVAQGGSEAGARFKKVNIDRHTLLVNKRTGRHAFASIDSPDSVPNCDPEFTAPDDVYEVSAHPPGFPIMLAFMLAPFRPVLDNVESDAAIVLALISWMGALVTYLTGRKAGMGRRRAMLAVFLLAGASTWLAYARSFFPEATIGLAITVALWAMVANRPAIAGIAIGFAAFLKPPFAIVGIAFMINELADGRRNKALKLAVTLAACGVAIVGFNYWLAHTWVIAGNSSWLRGSSFQALYDTFLEPGHGFFYFVPWSIIAFIAIVRAFFASGKSQTLLRQMGLPLVLYLLLLSCSGTGPGLSYGPRYWVPFLPWFALAVADSVSRAKRPALVACGILVGLSVLIAIPGAVRYPDIFSEPPWAALTVPPRT